MMANGSWPTGSSRRRARPSPASRPSSLTKRRLPSRRVSSAAPGRNIRGGGPCGHQSRKYGQVWKSALRWGRSPRVFLGVALLHGALERRRSPLEPALRSLLSLRVAQLNACRFCMDINSALLDARTGSSSRSEALGRWRDSSVFSEREQAALGYAEIMTRGEFPV